MSEQNCLNFEFVKMNGAGNDFVVLDNRSLKLALSARDIAKICDRHRGIGADGLLAVEPAREGGDYRMRYYNSDGGEAEMCGNGARCFAKFAASLDGAGSGTISFETPAGMIRAALLDGGDVELEMSPPHSFAGPVELEVCGVRLEVAFLNTGVPHAVVFVEQLEEVDVNTLGAGLRYHEHFSPRGTNVNFVQKDDDGISIRTYERGVEGETLACGTGVVACALLHHLRNGSASPIPVRVRGGDVMRVRFEAEARGDFRNVFLQGPADAVFTGTMNL